MEIRGIISSHHPSYPYSYQMRGRDESHSSIQESSGNTMELTTRVGRLLLTARGELTHARQLSSAQTQFGHQLMEYEQKCDMLSIQLNHLRRQTHFFHRESRRIESRLRQQKASLSGIGQQINTSSKGIYQERCSLARYKQRVEVQQLQLHLSKLKCNKMQRARTAYSTERVANSPTLIQRVREALGRVRQEIAYTGGQFRSLLLGISSRAWQWCQTSKRLKQIREIGGQVVLWTGAVVLAIWIRRLFFSIPLWSYGEESPSERRSWMSRLDPVPHIVSFYHSMRGMSRISYRIMRVGVVLYAVTWAKRLGEAIQWGAERAICYLRAHAIPLSMVALVVFFGMRRRV